jgi:hypothetical protein
MSETVGRTNEVCLPGCIRQTYALRGHSGRAPLAELWTYVKKELNEQRILPLEEYKLSFVAWVGRYIDEDPVILASQGFSLAGTAAAKLRRALSEASIKREGKKREKQNEKRRKALSSFTLGKRLQDASVENEAARQNKNPRLGNEKQSATNDTSSISIPKHARSSNLATDGAEVVGSGHSTARIVASQPETTITSLDTEANGEMQVNKTQNAQAEIGPSSDEDLVMQGLYESYFGQDSVLDNQDQEEDRNETSILPETGNTEHEHSSDSEVMSIRNDAVFRSYFQESPIDTRSHTSNDHSDKTLFHGKTVRITKSGDVNLITTDSDYIFVKFRINIKGLEAILSSGGSPTIHFSPTHLKLCIDQKPFYKTPNERLIQSSNGILWFDLILHELKVMYGSLESLSQIDDNTLFKTDPHADSCWRNLELQRRLLQGDNFHCGTMKNETAMGRVFFRDVAIFVPKHADFETVYVQCFLAPDGSRNPNACIEACATKNPANRLAIKVKFKNKTSDEDEEMWVSLRGKTDLMRVNSLVDFLEGKPEEYTEQQPLRFLRRSIRKGRPKISYTPDF